MTPKDIMTDTAHVSMSNTKKEMLDAYQSMKELIELKDKELVNLDKARKAAEKQASLAAAKAETERDPVRRIHELRSAISRELSELAEKFEAELESFIKLEVAVEEKKQELKDIYEVETAASDLAALIQAQQSRKNKFESEMVLAKDEWDKQKQRYEIELKEEKEQEKRERQREKNEYEYNLTRDREQRKNNLEDELAVVAKEIAQKRETFEIRAAEHDAKLKDRENAVAEHEAEFKNLRVMVENFPAERDAAVKAAIEEAEKKLTSDFEKEKALLAATFKGEKNVFLSKVEALEKQVAAQAEEHKNLVERQDRAYEKVQDIAGKAVASARREVISISADKSESKG